MVDERPPYLHPRGLPQTLKQLAKEFASPAQLCLLRHGVIHEMFASFSFHTHLSQMVAGSHLLRWNVIVDGRGGERGARKAFTRFSLPCFGRSASNLPLVSLCIFSRLVSRSADTSGA